MSPSSLTFASTVTKRWSSPSSHRSTTKWAGSTNELQTRFSKACKSLATTSVSMADTTVLVTGGTGFLGSYVFEHLIEHGHDVVAYDLSTDDHILSKLGVDDDVTIRRGDVSEATDVSQAVKETGTTHIVHLAALLTNTAESNPRAAMQVNIEGTSNVFEAARTLDDQVERVAWAFCGSLRAAAQLRRVR